MRAYTARRMTGRHWGELFAEAYLDRSILSLRGIDALDPVLAEIDETYNGLFPNGTCGDGYRDTPATLAAHWARDKRMIRSAHVLIDLSPGTKSEGIAHEIGLARYAYWKPVVRVFPEGEPVPRYSVAIFEDDLIVSGLPQAAIEIQRRWGTWPKRFWWRLRMYARSAPKHYAYKLRFWFQ